MIEKIKSITLTVLVCTSLLQSYFLAYSTPNFDMINPTKYVKTELIGTQVEVEGLLFPEQIILHYGDDTHTVLYPENTFYEMIFQGIRKRAFDGLHPVINTDIEWDQYRKQRQGVEILFEEGIPLNVLQRIMSIQQSDSYDLESIDRIWILTNDAQDEVKTYFFSDEKGMIYEAAKVDLIVKDVERFVGFGELQPKYRSKDGSFYLPEEPIRIMKLKMSFDEYTPEQLQKSLFADPGITRRIEEWDGTEIYTDGKRGLQVKKEQKWMIYTDPIAPVEDAGNVRENLLSAVQFINQHGGWNGKHAVSEISQNGPAEGQKFEFRQYVGSYPVLATQYANLGYMSVVLQKGVVSTYERSMLKLDEGMTVIGERELAAGEELEKKIAKYKKSFLIRSIFPAYRPYFIKDHIELIPEWAVKLSDDTSDFID